MLCSRCGKNEANVFYKQIVNNQVTELEFCASCAEKAHLPGMSGSPVFDLLAGLNPPSQVAEKRRQKAQCPACGVKYAQFRETGLLGCPVCYQSFAEPLQSLLKHIHGYTRHSGKAPPTRPAQQNPERPGQEAAQLRRQLQAAIEAEKFEEAARLRDRLRSLD